MTSSGSGSLDPEKGDLSATPVGTSLPGFAEKPGADITTVQRSSTEQEFLDKQLKFEESNLSFIGIYKYATWKDLVLVAISSVCAVAAGALIPVTPVRTALIA